MTEPRTVLVTGAGRGIGLAVVELLGRRGFRVVAGVRRPDALSDELAALVDAHPAAVLPMAVDLRDPDGYRATAGAIAELVGPGGLHGLVNNAGYAQPAPLEFLSLEQLRDQLEVNLVGQLGVTQAVLPLLRTARGRVVNVTSVGGLVAGPVLGAYHMSKFGLEAMSDTLRQELRHLGVGVTAIEPGAVDTGIWDEGVRRSEDLVGDTEVERLYGHLMHRAVENARTAGGRGISPGEVAAVILDALTARRAPARRTVGREARIGSIAARLPARLLDRMLAGGPAPAPERVG